MIRAGLIASAGAIVVMIATWAWLAQNLPLGVAEVPIHWGIDGQPNGYASRDQALLLFGMLPVLGAVIAALMCAAPALDPMRANVAKSGRAFLVAWIGGEAMLALATVGAAILMVRSVGGEIATSAAFVRLVIAAAGLLIIFIGDALPKTRPNFFVGVRTPWTLSSDLSWEKTHRLAGRLFVLVGIWEVISAFVLNGAQLIVGLGGPLIAIVVATFIYSYLVWRRDPNRRRPAEET